MINHKNQDLLFLPVIRTALVFILFVGCQGKSANNLYVQLNHVVLGEALDFEQMKYKTAAGHGYEVSRLKYYISTFELKKADGSIYLVDDVHYCDARDTSTCHFVLEPIPDANYTELSFLFGLDDKTNVKGGLENNLINSNMAWPIPGEEGYHYMKFEGRYDSMNTGVIKSFNLHTGPTKNNLNYFKINVDLSDLDIHQNSWIINLEMDLDRWLHDPVAYDFSEFGQGIMSNQNAQQILKQNGHNVFNLVSARRL